MKIPTVECPKCKSKLSIEISDKDIILLIAKRLNIEVEIKQ